MRPTTWTMEINPNNNNDYAPVLITPMATY